MPLITKEIDIGLCDLLTKQIFVYLNEYLQKSVIS